MKQILLGSFLFLFMSSCCIGQRTWDQKIANTLLDSVLLKKRETKPIKATLLSAIFPGAGQAYNRQYYKLHIVYGAIGGMIYSADFNRRQFNLFDKAYRARLRGEDMESSEDLAEFADAIPTASIANARQDFRKSKELAYFGLGLVYLLNVMDAYVSSHLTTFNIEDDLVKGRLKLIDKVDITGRPLPVLGMTIDF